MRSEPGRSDVLIALRMLVDVVGERLGRMTSERPNCVADDGHLPRGDGDVGAHPGVKLPVCRIEPGSRRSGFLEGFRLIRSRETRGTRELFGGSSERERLHPGDVIAGPIVPISGQDGDGHISQVIARDP